MAERPAAAATAASSSIATSNEKSDEKISTNKVHHFPQASNPYSSWDSMWSQMTREGGWIEAKFDNDNKSYYIHPHIKNNVLGLVGSNNDWSFMEGEELEMGSNYTEGVHYFNSLQSLQKYAKEHLGWVGDGSSTDMEVEDSNNETVTAVKIRALNSGSRELLFKAVYFGGVHQTADIRLASLRRYYGEDGNECLDYPGGSILEKSGLISIRNNPIDTTYRIKVQLRDMEDAIGKDFYKKGFYKFILDRINRSYENKTRPLQQQKKSANGMNNRKQPTNRNRNEPINQEKDNTSSLQRTTATTSNENGTTIERRPTNSMANTSAVASAAATESSPVNNAATAAAKRVSLSPDTTKKELPKKRSNRVSKGNDDQVDKKKAPIDQDKVHENNISDIWNNYLKKDRGWEYRSGALEAFAFFPGSLLKKKIKPGSIDIYPDDLFEKYTAGEIKKKGKQGIHWANGWKELGEMILKYGYNHAPKSLNDVNPQGWEYTNGDDGETCAFIPGSLLEKYTKEVVKKKGKRGIHWANGELELGEMLSTYGYLYAPKDLDDANPQELDKKVSVQDIIDYLFVEEKVGGGKKKSGSSASSAASTTTVAPVATAKSKAATRERDETAPSGATTSSSSSSSQAKASTSGQAGLKRKTVEADDKRKKKQKKKESNPSGNERKKEKIGNNSSTSSGSSASNVISTTVAAPVAAAKSNNQDRAAEEPQTANTKKKDKKKSSSSKLTPNMKRFMNKSISTLAQEYDSMSKEIEKNKQEMEEYKAKDLEYDNMSKAVDDSKKEIKELKACLGSKDASINTLRKENEKLEGNATSRNGFISRLQGKIDTQKKEIVTLKKEGSEKNTEMTTLRNEKNKLVEQVKRMELLIQAYERRMVSDERKHNASQAQQQRHDALAQSVSSEEDGMSEDDKELQAALAKTIVDENDLKVDWDDVAGLLEVKEQLKMATLAPIRFPSSFVGNRKAWKGILLYGPPGTGKTHIAMAAASALSKEVDCTVFFIKASDIDSKWKGDSARLVKNLFDMARKGKRAIIFIDEVDSLCVSRDGAIDTTDQRIVTEFLNQMDGGVKNDNVLVIGATNLPWDLDTAMRRRFESRVHIPLPDKDARQQLFKIHLGDTPSTLTENDIETLAQSTEGASGADIQVLVKKKALMEAVNEGQRSKHFRLEQDLYVPTLPCDDCPRQISMDQSNTCGCCGAMRMGFFDIPNDRFKARDVSMEDFKKYLKSSYSTVSEEELQQYAAWTKDFGEGGGRRSEE